MLWLKGWMELRTRLLLLVLAIAVPYGLLAPRLGAGMPEARLAVMAANMQSLAYYLAWPAFAVLFAGAGINTLSGAFGTGRRVHPSMYFTLSLPVTRARLLLVRAVAGVAGYAALIVAVTVVVWALAPVMRARIAPAELLVYLFTAVAGALVAYSAAVLLATFLAEQNTMFAGFIVLAPLWQLQSRVAWLAPPRFGEVNWILLGFTAAVSALLLFAAIRVAERRQY